MRTALSRLSPADGKEMEELTRSAMRDVNWFAVTVFVSGVMFGLVGFLGGLISRTWFLAAILPVIPFAINSPIVRFEMAKDLAPFQKVIVMVVQFAACCLLAVLGARIAAKRNQRAANNTPEPIVAKRAEGSV